MAFDGISAACIVCELEKTIKGGRIDKITQPERDEINITIRSNGQSYRLLLSASSSGPRIHLTTRQKENPEKAPMFCMLLRKHISGGKILAFKQPDFERVIRIEIECYNELGDLSTKTLTAEIMGKHSNIILTDSEDKILGSIKQVDFTVSSVRQVIAGMRYEMPPSQGKRNPLHISADELLHIIYASDLPCDKFILETFTGVSPLNAREIAHTALGGFESAVSELTIKEKQALAKGITAFFDKIKKCEFSPVLMYREENKPWDFNAVEVYQYGSSVKAKGMKSLSEALDEFARARYTSQRLSQRAHSLLKLVDNNIHRCRKKIGLLNQTIEKSAEKEKYKIFGDLLTANLYNIKENTASYTAENYYDNMKKMEIPLVAELSPSKNAQRYYNLYQKAKNAQIMSKKQLEITQSELSYLESVYDSLTRAESESDIDEINSELAQQGYKTGRVSPSKAKKAAASAPHRFMVDGFLVYVGKNNLQNDNLTLKEARANDLWFHVKSFPGSHTIMKTDGREPSEDTIVKTAKIAAYYSKARDSANVPVDFTVIRNVKKPRGAKPGAVIYENYSTVNVKPERPDA